LRLSWAALIQGHQTKLSGFRYLDAGCGQGLSLILMAAAHPDSEFVGIDFLPEHIAHASSLAASCGLKNIKFLEADFTELAKDHGHLGQFDYAVCHGISTWIAPQVRTALYEFIGKTLVPGGLFYNSYNTYPGWLTTMPFQHLVLLHQQSLPGGQALKLAQENMKALKDSNSVLFTALPTLSARMDKMGEQDPAYLVQEYNNQFWQPMFVNQMMAEMASAKLTYLGTATLPEAFDSSFPQGIRDLIAAQPTTELKETVRDLAMNQAFRRDLYVKGKSTPWTADFESQILSARVVYNPSTARPAKDEAFSISGATVRVSGSAEFYGKILDVAEKHSGGLSIADLQRQLATKNHWRVMAQSVALLVHGGWLSLQKEDAGNDSGRKVNHALARAVCSGAPYRYVSLPGIGGGQPVTELEWFVISAVFQGLKSEAWAEYALATLKRLGRSTAQDGKVVTDPRIQAQIIGKAIGKLQGHRLEFFRQMGGI